MPDKKARPGSLLGSEATGGEIAERGLRFQDRMALARIPVWLAQSGFCQVIREALGDTEAKFFVPGRGSCREFNEYKNHRLTPSEFWPEIDRFLELETAHPNAYHAYRLVCTDLNDELRVICRALDRIRRALPFYDGVTSIEDGSLAEIAEKVVASARRDLDYVEFMFNKVYVDFEAPRQAELAYARWQIALEREMPECIGLNGSQVKAAWLSLGEILGSRTAEPIARADLIEGLQKALPEFAFPTLERTRLFTASEPESQWMKPRSALTLPWMRFSGGQTRAYPGANEWQAGLEELVETRDWILASGAPRTIRLQGTRRLSGSVALGATFAATGGFVVEVETRGDVLVTDQHAGATTSEYDWRVRSGGGSPADEIGIVISVKRDIEADVRGFLSGVCEIELSLYSSEAMGGADQINRAVELAKKQISLAVSRTQASVVHLFLAVPGPFALFLGHRLNATCTIQCYEYTGSGRYCPTFRIPCT